MVGCNASMKAIRQRTVDSRRSAPLISAAGLSDGEKTLNQPPKFKIPKPYG
jgi:hypothetical protein